MLRGLIIAVTVSLSLSQIGDIQHTHDDATLGSSCMTSFAQTDSKGDFDTGGMQLCDCENLCTFPPPPAPSPPPLLSNTWKVDRDEMHATKLKDIAMCVVKQMPYNQTGADPVLGNYAEEYSSFFGGCVQNGVSEDGYWYADHKQWCVLLLDTEQKGQKSFVLKKDKKDCTNGWKRHSTNLMAYEMI